MVRTVFREAELLLEALTGTRIQNQLVVTWSAGKVEHTVQGTSKDIARSAADSPEFPVVFDEAQDRRLVGDEMIDVVCLGPRRNHQQVKYTKG
jgi:hypothetical protein